MGCEDRRNRLARLFFEARRDGSEVFELVEEALDQISKAVEVGTERGDVDPTRRGFDVPPCALRGEACAQGVAVITAIGQQDLAFAKVSEQIGGALSVV